MLRGVGFVYGDGEERKRDARITIYKCFASNDNQSKKKKKKKYEGGGRKCMMPIVLLGASLIMVFWEKLEDEDIAIRPARRCACHVAKIVSCLGRYRRRRLDVHIELEDNAC